MIRSIFYISLCCLILTSCYKDREFYLGGIQVNEADQDVWADTLKSSGLNTAALTVYAFQKRWYGSELHYSKKNPGLITELRAAKKEGLKTVFIIRLALDSAVPENKFLWHGMVLPYEKEKRKLWFQNYEAFALHWAKIAEEEGIDVFGIGSEMTALTSTRPVADIPHLESYHLDLEAQEKEEKAYLAISDDKDLLKSMRKVESKEPRKYFLNKKQALREWAKKVTFWNKDKRVERINEMRKDLASRWDKLIRNIRKVYTGKLTYAAGFDQYKEVTLWKELDHIGINAYFPLRDVEEELVEDKLIESWTKVFDEISEFKEENKYKEQKVLFTEIGYTFRDNSTIYPWAAESYDLIQGKESKKIIVWNKQKVNYSERVMALRSLRKSLSVKKRDYFAGLLYWKFSTHDYHEKVEPFVHVLQSKKDAQFTDELYLMSESK